MANTYFNINITDSEKYDRASDVVSLTAFMGGDKSIQMSLNGANGYSCIMLSNEDARRIAGALLERVDGEISATGFETSEFTDIEEEETESI